MKDAAMARIRIDRFEEDLAVLAWNGRSFDVPRALLPPEAREGDVLALVFGTDAVASEADRRAVAEKRARLSRDDDGGDFSL